MDGIENRKITVFAGALVCVYVLLVSTGGNSFAITFCIVPPSPSPSLTAQCVGKLGDKEHCLWTMGGDGGCSSKEGGARCHQKGRGRPPKKGKMEELMIRGKDTDSFGDKIYHCVGCQAVISWGRLCCDHKSLADADKPGMLALPTGKFLRMSTKLA